MVNFVVCVFYHNLNKESKREGLVTKALLSSHVIFELNTAQSLFYCYFCLLLGSTLANSVLPSSRYNMNPATSLPAPWPLPLKFPSFLAWISEVPLTSLLLCYSLLYCSSLRSLFSVQRSHHSHYTFIYLSSWSLFLEFSSDKNPWPRGAYILVNTAYNTKTLSGL